MSMVNQLTDQQTHDNSSTIMITSPDRNHQAECSLILPSVTNAPVSNEENSKLILKKEESIPVTIEEVPAAQTEATGQCNAIKLISEYVWHVYKFLTNLSLFK